MKFLLFSLFVLLLPVREVFAQKQLPPPSRRDINSAYISGNSSAINIECSGLRTPQPTETDWQVQVVSVDHRERDAPTKAIKDSLFALKILNDRPFGTDNQSMKTIDLIVKNASFKGYSAPATTPTDNSLAISNGGIIVSAVNSSFEIFNDRGILLMPQITFKQYVADPTLLGSFFDPKVIYDSQSDRFVMIVLHSSAPSKSRVIVMFSKTSNPVDGWWVYKLAGDAVGKKSWFDYPNLAVNNDEVFITGNLYDSLDDFQEAIVLQIGKDEGYAGNALQIRVWNNIKIGTAQIPFTLVPAGYGHQGNYGPGIFLVSSLPDGGNEVYLFRITGNRNDPSTSILSYTIDVPPAVFPADARQKGSTDLLDAGKCRIRNAFFLDGIVHFVFSSANVNGYGQITYGRLDTDAKLAMVSRLSLNGLDYTYPSVVSFAVPENHRSVLIAFTCSGADVFPEIRVCTSDNDMNFNNSQQAYGGSSHVEKSFGSLERWGDYVGVSRRHTSNFPDVWIAAPYGASQTWNTRIMRYSAEKDSVPLNDTVQTLNFYPNPVSFADFYFTFTETSTIEITLYDLQGKEVKQLFNDVILKGEKRILFNREALATGFYIAVVKSNGRIIQTEKIVVVDKN